MMYKILVAEDEPSADEAATALENMVNVYLHEGWKTEGGVSLAYDSLTENYSAAQAIVKEINK